jgi:hypothetical protein
MRKSQRQPAQPMENSIHEEGGDDLSGDFRAPKQRETIGEFAAFEKVARAQDDIGDETSLKNADEGAGGVKATRSVRYGMRLSSLTGSFVSREAILWPYSLGFYYLVGTRSDDNSQVEPILGRSCRTEMKTERRHISLHNNSDKRIFGSCQVITRKSAGTATVGYRQTAGSYPRLNRIGHIPGFRSCRCSQ